MSEATDENDLDLAIAVFCEGIHIDKEEEDRSDRVGTGHIPWDKGSKIGWLLEMQYLESDGSNFETYSDTHAALTPTLAPDESVCYKRSRSTVAGKYSTSVRPSFFRGTDNFNN